jgi:MoxR-like ATPase
VATQETAPAPERPVERSAPTFSDLFGRITRNVEQVIQGKPEVIELALVALVAEGHLLIEDVPGVGKTSMAKALAASIDCTWGRVQFTPDLLPSDVVGVTVWNRGTSEFEFRPGPIFANIVLGDEINRASPKTQSALLEAMEERQVTVDGTTYPLEAPFMVIATQNPIDHEGTYPLPESQLDRFLLRVAVGYPDRSAELEILDAHADHSMLEELQPVATAADVRAMTNAARLVHVAPSLKGYLVDLAEASRRHPGLALGMSPRATLSLQRAARAMAAANGRNYVLPDDVKALAGPVLAHRLMLTPEAQLQGADASSIVADVLASVPVPSGRTA